MPNNQYYYNATWEHGSIVGQHYQAQKAYIVQQLPSAPRRCGLPLPISLTHTYLHYHPTRNRLPFTVKRRGAGGRGHQQVKLPNDIILHLHTAAHSLFRAARSFLCPPRMREICRPLLKAWLNSILVWNSETNGNQARNAIGVNNSKPMMIS